jgi:predicted small secreted protein
MNRILIGAVSLLACAGCNTMSGLGADIQAAGSALTQNAHDTKDVQAPEHSVKGCTPDYSRAPPVTCEKTNQPNRTEQVRLAPVSQQAVAAPAKPAPKAAADTKATPAAPATKMPVKAQ